MASPFIWAAGAIVLSLFVRFLQKLHFHRSLVKDLPGPPHSYLWGSLRSMGEVLSQQPRRASPQTFTSLLAEKHNLPDYLYLDPWPLGFPIMMIYNVEMLNEIAINRSLPKHPAIRHFLDPFGGPGSMITEDGTVWRKWRSAFNSGFSNGHLMTLIPLIVDECRVFCDIMKQHGRAHDLFRMETATTKLTVDIIGKVVLDLAFNTQRGSHPLVDRFISQTHWLYIGPQFNPWELIDIRRPIMLRYNTWQMNRYLSRELDRRFTTRAQRSKSKHIIDLALEAYLKEAKGSSADMDTLKHLDPEFKIGAVSNLKTFIFAGHDTTSGAICYAYYYLSKHPEMLAKAQKELDDVFGADIDTVPDQLTSNPHLLNKLEYILAVVREALRLQPPASTLRIGQKGYFLRDPVTGEPLPTEHFAVWPANVSFGRHATYWSPDPSAFRPERFLPPNKYDHDAYIPFSRGSRNCIGQELALIEARVILAMTLRSWDVEIAMDEVKKLKGDGTGYPCDLKGIQTQFGEELYQIQLGTAKPREGMPCRIVLKS